VAPLTTTVLDAVAPGQTGVASGINNAVASVASLVAIAFLGTIAIATFDRSLDSHLTAADASPEVRKAVEGTRGGLVISGLPGGLSEKAAEVTREVARESLLETFRLVVVIAAGAAFAATIAAALMIGGTLTPVGRRSNRTNESTAAHPEAARAVSESGFPRRAEGRSIGG